MQTSGNQSTTLTWGEPRVRPFRGMFVRWIEWMQRRWPRASISLLNSGRDAASLLTVVPCLLTRLPPKVDPVVLEAGSMWLDATNWMPVEHITRQLLTMRSPPAVVYLTVHAWCAFGGSEQKRTLSHGIKELPPRHYGFYKGRAPGGLNEPQPYDAQAERCAGSHDDTKSKARERVPCSKSDKLEDGLNRLCEHYHVACVSQRDAMLEGFLRRRDGFAIQDIAGDCLHPVHGKRGVDYMTDLLVHWTERAAAAVATSAAAATSSVPPRGGQQQQQQHLQPSRVSLPPPLDSKGAMLAESTSAACYGFDSARSSLSTTTGGLGHGGGGEGIGVLKAREQAGGGGGGGGSASELPWDTVDCPSTAMSGAEAHHSQPPFLRSTVDVLKSCAAVPPNPPNASRAEGCGGSAGWAWCERSLRGKLSPGVAAFKPGAALLVPLPTWWTPKGTHNFTVTLQYLTSWSRVGIAEISCLDRCACDAHTLDALRVAANGSTPNATIFAEHSFGVGLLEDRRAGAAVEASSSPSSSSPSSSSSSPSPSSSPSAADSHAHSKRASPPSPCGLMVRVLDRTSTTGHHFKLRDVILTVNTRSPCQIHKPGAGWKFLSVRNGLLCHDKE